MIPKFLTVAVGKIYVASKSILGGSVMFFCYSWGTDK